MYEQIEKPKENKTRAVADSVAQKKSNAKQGFGFVDNRPNGTITSNRTVNQFIKTTSEDKIPVQTGGNCGLFSIITSLRAFGFEKTVQDKAISVLDKFTETSEDTLQGEVFTVDLMINIINGLEIDSKKILTCTKEDFNDENSLKDLMLKYKDDNDVTLLIGYSKPDEYDDYYESRAVHLAEAEKPNNQLKTQHALTDMQTKKVLKDSVNTFKAQHAHWGMVNKITNNLEYIELADNFREGKKGANHGYNTEISLSNLYKSNMSLSSNDFNWKSFLTQPDHKNFKYRGIDGKTKKKDITTAKTKKNINNLKLTEKMDLSGKIVVIRLTDYGKTLAP